ncbi:NRDE family protein [Natrialbaceae archaeon A-CW1-1]
MCTLILAWQVFESHPVTVAANRDERLDRASEPLGVYATDPEVIAPRDTSAGGTWIGINAAGLFAGITNRWTDVDLAGERSRGHLVADALARESATAARDVIVDAVERTEYDGFTLVVADADSALALEWDGSLRITAFEPGVHVVANTGIDDRFDIPDHRSEVARRQAENARAVRRTLSAAVSEADSSSAWLERAAAVLADHEYGVCVHGNGYGTRSSSLIALGVPSHYLFADGPPCQTAFRSVGGAESQSRTMTLENLTDLEGHI